MSQTKDLHKELVEACKENNAKAQMQLYDLYCKAMCIIANRYVKDDFVAEDIMQDSFIKAFQNIHSFKGEVSFGAWLKRIVINNSLDWLKKQKLELPQILSLIIPFYLLHSFCFINLSLLFLLA